MKNLLIGALMSLASATISDDLFMQAEETELYKMKAGICQPLVGTKLLDISKFDRLGRVKNDPATHTFQHALIGGESTLSFKTCQPDFPLFPEEKNAETL